MRNLSLWQDSALFAATVYAASFLYVLFYRNLLSAVVLSDALAITGGILIGCSFALSGMSYFFNFLDPVLRYRKALGLIGYYCALAYSISLLFIASERYLISFPSWLFEPDALLGGVAMLIFTMMAVISSDRGTKAAGLHFRPLLRVGYLAYILLVVRAWYLEGDIWMSWLEQLDTLPPPRLLLSVFAISVIGLRVLLEIAVRLNPRRQPTPQTSLP